MCGVAANRRSTSCALKTDKLSTKFEDWIERDLLQLNTWDIRRVSIDDYSIDIVQGIQIPRSRMVVEYDDKDVKWTLRECRVFEGDRWVDRPLAEDEELDTTKLNDMKWALDDLKIVDVRRKPAGLSQNLRELGEIKLDQETVKSLAERGFYLVRLGNRYELLSSEGEIVVLMKDGVQYVLRFGGIAAGTGGGAEQAQGEGSQASGSSGTNRYLFVMAEFNPDGIPKPELAPLPELPPEAGTGSSGPGGRTLGRLSRPRPAREAGSAAEGKDWRVKWSFRGRPEAQSQPAGSRLQANRQPAAAAARYHQSRSSYRPATRRAQKQEQGEAQKQEKAEEKKPEGQEPGRA